MGFSVWLSHGPDVHRNGTAFCVEHSGRRLVLWAARQGCGGDAVDSSVAPGVGVGALQAWVRQL